MAKAMRAYKRRGGAAQPSEVASGLEADGKTVVLRNSKGVLYAGVVNGERLRTLPGSAWSLLESW
jgi:hypothetical protein